MNRRQRDHYVAIGVLLTTFALFVTWVIVLAVGGEANIAVLVGPLGVGLWHFYRTKEK